MPGPALSLSPALLSLFSRAACSPLFLGRSPATGASPRARPPPFSPLQPLAPRQKPSEPAPKFSLTARPRTPAPPPALRALRPLTRGPRLPAPPLPQCNNPATLAEIPGHDPGEPSISGAHAKMLRRPTNRNPRAFPYPPIRSRHQETLAPRRSVSPRLCSAAAMLPRYNGAPAKPCSSSTSGSGSFPSLLPSATTPTSPESTTATLPQVTLIRAIAHCRCRSGHADLPTATAGAPRVDSWSLGARRTPASTLFPSSATSRRRTSPTTSLRRNSGHHNPSVSISIVSPSFCASFGRP